MKKEMVSVLLILLVSTSLCAQFRAGVKGGFNLSNINMEMRGVDFDLYNTRIGAHTGLMAEYMFSQHVGLHTELIYINNGATINSDKYLQGVEKPDNVSVEGYVTRHTFELPLYLKTKFMLTPTIKLYTMGGAFASLTPNGEQHMKVMAEGESLKVKWSLFDPKIQIMDEIETNLYMQQRFNVGMAFEAGIEKDRFTVGLGFSKVLNNMSAMGIIGVGKPTIKMWTANLSVGYYF